MKHVTTVLGQKYCVYTDLDCEVRNAVTGRLLLVARPGQPNVFPAPCAAVTLSAEDADCVLFECAPADFILFGWGAPAWFHDVKAELLALLGEENVKVELINSERTLVVHTDRAADEELAAVDDVLVRALPQHVSVDRYNHNMEIHWRDIDKYAKCTTLAEMYAVNSDWKKDLTSEKEWIYPLTGLVESRCGYQEYTNSFARSPMLSATLYCPNLTSFHYGCWSCGVKKVHFYAPRLVGASAPFRWTEIEEITGDLSSLATSTDFVTYAPLKSWTIPLPKLSNARAFFYKCTKLNEIAVDFPSLSSADLFACDCELDKTSVLRICDSIPAYASGSHPITLGVHADHQSDAEVLAAIENAESKGWTVAVQWNGTPTAAGASAYGLRRPTIYARLGTYKQPDGISEQILDWGHYVTDAEKNGYMEFGSIDEACEYFGLNTVD